MKSSVLLVLGCICACAASCWALEDADIAKKVKDLKDADPKVRAAAIEQLAPFVTELVIGMQKAQRDPSPEVREAMNNLDKQMRAAAEKDPGMAPSRMAANETAALAACKAYCTAQDIYRRTDYNKDGVLEYSQALKGKFSLYENEPGAGDIALIDKSFANAEAGPDAIPKAGYYFKVLAKQGASASGGARTFMTNGRMTLGYALLAYPAEYDKTGRNTFLISNAGTVYQKDQGGNTKSIAEGTSEFNPDNTWVIAE